MPPKIPPTTLTAKLTSSILFCLPSSTTHFSTTSIIAGKYSKHRLSKLLSQAPPYPYPIKHTYKQSWFGLYASKHIQFGNNRPDSELTITRRSWHPNIKHKKLWSFGLGEWVECKLATNVLRTIDKVGGLDNYLLSEQPARLKELGPWGWRLRFRLQSTKAIQRKYQADRVKMGLITTAEMLKQNREMGINRGMQVNRFEYKKVKTSGAKHRVREFKERWSAAGKVLKVLPGVPWRWRRLKKEESLRSAKRQKRLMKRREKSIEVVVARKKEERRKEKKMEIRRKKELEDRRKMMMAMAGRPMIEQPLA